MPSWASSTHSKSSKFTFEVNVLDRSTSLTISIDLIQDLVAGFGIRKRLHGHLHVDQIPSRVSISRIDFVPLARMNLHRNWLKVVDVIGFQFLHHCSRE